MIVTPINTAAIASFLKEKVGLFRDFSAGHLQSLVAGSRAGSFEANEAIAHHGAEATHFGVVLSGAVNASILGDGGTRRLADRGAGVHRRNPARMRTANLEPERLRSTTRGDCRPGQTARPPNTSPTNCQ